MALLKVVGTVGSALAGGKQEMQDEDGVGASRARRAPARKPGLSISAARS
jgi:hypothetical protein